MTAALFQTKTQTLEDRLNRLDNSIREILVNELLKPKVRPRDIIKESNRYIKDDLAPYIVQRLKEDGVSFESVGGEYAFKENLYNSIGKEPMKRAYWGQFNAYVPKEIMQELPPWSAFYLYAGVWTKKSTTLPHKRFFRNSLKNQPVYKIIHSCVIEGMDTIKKIHNSEYKKGAYKHPLRATPHKKDVEEMMPKPRDTNYAQPSLPFGN